MKKYIQYNLYYLNNVNRCSNNVVEIHRSQLLFFVFFRRGEVSSEALTVVKKVGFAP